MRDNSREDLLDRLKAAVKPMESFSNDHSNEDDEILRRSQGEIPHRERTYLNASYYGNTFSPSRELNFKDGAPITQAVK